MKMTKGPVVIYVEGGTEKRRGVKAISSDWVDGGGGVNFFIRKFRGSAV